MELNRQIVIATVVIMAAGVYRVTRSKQGGGLTRLLVGGYLLAVAASVADLLGGPVSHVAGLLMMLAMATAVAALIPDLFGNIIPASLDRQARNRGGAKPPSQT